MNKKIIIGISVSIGILAILVIASSGGSSKSSNATANVQNSQNKTVDQGYSSRFQSTDKIEVVHFHATQQCWSCITVGEYALKTIKERFPEEYKNGMIVFKDVNGELAENGQLVEKYQARGSSLFVNTIINGQDHIEEDVNVWRLIASESQFISYFSNKLNNLLGR